MEKIKSCSGSLVLDLMWSLDASFSSCLRHQSGTSGSPLGVKELEPIQHSILAANLMSAV